MAINYDQLLKDPRVIKKLSNEQLAEYLEDEDALPNDVEGGETVLSVGWDSNGPGGSGAIWVICWQGLYFCTSSDDDSEGPFESLDEALQVEWFSNPSFRPEIDSEVIPLKRLKRIALGLLGEDGGHVFIRGKPYVTKAGVLVPCPDDDPSNHEEAEDG